MFAVCVEIKVKPENVDEFLAATLENARATRQEPGNMRFDVLRRQDNATAFTLYEVYCDESGMAAHKETPHYAKWRDTVEPWMAEPRVGLKHDSIFPEDEKAW